MQYEKVLAISVLILVCAPYEPCARVVVLGDRSSRVESAAMPSASTIIKYNGWLEEGKTYRAAVRYGSAGELELIIPLRILAHHAARVEWSNLEDYPALKAANHHSKWIVFNVVSKRTVRVAEQYRWNDTYHCRIEKTLSRGQNGN